MIRRKRSRIYNAVHETFEEGFLTSKQRAEPLNYFPKELVVDGIDLWVENIPHQPEFHLLHKCAKLIGLTTGVPYDEQGKIKEDISLDLRVALPIVVDTLRHIDKHSHHWVDIYNPRVALLITTLKRLFDDGDVYERPEAMVRRSSEDPEGFKLVRISHLINEFIVQVRKVLRSKKFSIKEGNWLGEYRRRMKSAKEYVHGLFSIYSKLLVVRIDLYQEKFKGEELQRRCDEGWETPGSELETLQGRVDQLLANRRHNKLFEHCVGFIIKLEYAPIRGWHAHAIFFFKGQEVENDSHHSVVLGNYWVDVITEGEGAYRAANRAENKSQYRYCGIGMIDHRDTAKRDILIHRVIDYLAKSDLHVRSKGYAEQKLFRKGVLPKLPARRLGRPRLNAGQASAAAYRLATNP
ncbi:MAG: inovirus-type Gp2 protein [Acidovorax sp.]|nr:inovirus-type Gp2 protein [Acidovorax sp.]